MERRRGSAAHMRLEDFFYEVMSKFNNKQWNEFARNSRKGLNLPEYQIDDIKADYMHDVREQKYQMLSLWQRRNGRRANVEYLEKLVENFLHPPPAPPNFEPSTNPQQSAQDVVATSPNNYAQTAGDVSTTNADDHIQRNRNNDEFFTPLHRSAPVASNLHNDTPESLPQQSPGRAQESYNVHSNPNRADNSHENQPISHIAHGRSSLPNRASNSLDSCQGHDDCSSRSTASTSIKEVGSVCATQQSTRPKAIASSSNRTFCEPSKTKNNAMPIHPIQVPFNPFAASRVHINVTGKNAIGTQTNIYYGGKKVEKRQTATTETPKSLAEYCSCVGDIKISPSDHNFYEEHLERQDMIYKITHKPKGAVLILNNSFPNDPDQRHGSGKDVENMERLWEKLGCKVILKTEVTAAESLATFKRFASSRVAYDSDFVVIVIMSHGGREKGEDVFYGADRGTVQVREMLDIFNNKNARRLQGIPKLFFFQFCRGDDVDKGADAMARLESSEVLFNSLETTVRESSGAPSAGDATVSGGILTTKQPTMSDTMISFATQEGYKAFRNNQNGSWYINAIVNIFMRHAYDQHLVELMTMVNNAVASKTANNEEDHTVHEGKEMSDFKSTLRKKLFFFPGFPDDSKEDFT